MINEKKTPIRIVGTGMDGKITLTAEARGAIGSSDVLIGAKRVTEPFSALGKPIFNTWKAEEISEIIRREKFNNPCILMSGDCGFYSAAELISRKLSEFNVEIIPGISSAAYFAAKIKIPWQNIKFVSLHGAENSIVRNVCKNKFCFFLLGGEFTVNAVCKRLCEYGLSALRVYSGEDLAYPNEKITSGTAAEFAEKNFSPLSVMLVENPNHEQGIKIGIPDEGFIRGEVPMTKSEVRSVIISKLGICDADTCWDIGCGTGSVTVEMALQCGSGHVYAADISEAAIKLTNDNCVKFGCDNVSSFCGSAPGISENFPEPDCVFIGGSGGKLPEILDQIFKKARKNARIVLTAVTLDTLETARRELSKRGIVPEIVQCAFTRVSGRSMMTSLNPIFIIKGIKK